MLKLIGSFSVVLFPLSYAKNIQTRRHSEYQSYFW